MKWLTACSLALVTLFFLASAQGDRIPDRPSNVPENAWVPITPNMGFVIVSERPPSSATGPGFQYGSRLLHGYFIVFHDNQWRPIDSAPESRLIPAGKR